MHYYELLHKTIVSIKQNKSQLESSIIKEKDLVDREWFLEILKEI
jgi:hypothetical protein